MTVEPQNKATLSANDRGRRPSETETTITANAARESTINEDGKHVPTAAVEIGWIERLMRDEGPGILRMLWRMLGKEQDAMDAYQDCFCKLVSRGSPSNIDSTKAYAYRTATNIAIEMLRSRKRRSAHWPAIAASRAKVQEQGAVAEDEVSGSSRSRATRLREAVTRLPAHLRNVIVLRDLSKMSYAEVAGTLGIEPGTARVYRRHAVVKLAELLGEGMDYAGE